MRIGLILLGVVGLAGLSAPAEAQGCGAGLRAQADAESFTSAGRNAARGTGLAQSVGTAFADAAAHLCSAGTLRAADFAPYRTLLVRNAEGAAEPNVYDDAEGSPGALIIEYAFTDGPAPAQAAIERALRCWKQPESEGCAAEDMGP